MKYFTTMLLAVALPASVIGCKSKNFFPEKIILLEGAKIPSP